MSSLPQDTQLRGKAGIGSEICWTSKPGSFRDPQCLELYLLDDILWNTVFPKMIIGVACENVKSCLKSLALKS